MKTSIYRGKWAGSSHLKERRMELEQAHEEFLKMVNNGWKIASAKPKRKRIQRTPQPKMVVTIVFGKETRVTIEEFETMYKPLNFKIVEEIY